VQRDNSCVFQWRDRKGQQVIGVGGSTFSKCGNSGARDSPFVCDDTPLGKGHIIALFLGGPDIPENYAPQYEQWQQVAVGKRWKMISKHSPERITSSVRSINDLAQHSYSHVIRIYRLSSVEQELEDKITLWCQQEKSFNEPYLSYDSVSITVPLAVPLC
jgi:hypothetical protein